MRKRKVEALKVRRANALVALDDGHSVQMVSRIFYLDPDTVRGWLTFSFLPGLAPGYTHASLPGALTFPAALPKIPYVGFSPVRLQASGIRGQLGDMLTGATVRPFGKEVDGAP